MMMALEENHIAGTMATKGWTGALEHVLPYECEGLRRTCPPMAVNREGLPRIGSLQATYIQVRGQVRPVMRDFLEFIQLLHGTCLNEADFQRVLNTPIAQLIALTDREVTKVKMTYKSSTITKMLMAFPGWAEDSQEGWARNGIRLNELMLVEIIAMVMVVGTDRFQQGPNRIAETMTQTGQGRQELRATARQRTTLLMYMRPKAMKYLLWPTIFGDGISRCIAARSWRQW